MNMRCLILCGGFARRMWPLTLHQSKILLEVAGKPVLSYTIEKLEKIEDIDEIIISTNAKFEHDFRKWMDKNKCTKPLRLIVEPALHEGEKFGAIKAINYAIENANVNDDVLILFGDNLDDMNLAEMITFYKKKHLPTTTAYDTQDLEVAKRMGVVALDHDNKIIDFEEKPEIPKSTLVSIGRQIYPKRVLNMFKEYLEADNPKDAPGYFLQWLYKKMPVYAFHFKGHWFDIGDHEILKKAEEWVKLGSI